MRGYTYFLPRRERQDLRACRHKHGLRASKPLWANRARRFLWDGDGTGSRGAGLTRGFQPTGRCSGESRGCSWWASSIASG